MIHFYQLKNLNLQKRDRNYIEERNSLIFYSKHSAESAEEKLSLDMPALLVPNNVDNGANCCRLLAILQSYIENIKCTIFIINCAVVQRKNI